LDYTISIAPDYVGVQRGAFVHDQVGLPIDIFRRQVNWTKFKKTSLKADMQYNDEIQSVLR